MRMTAAYLRSFPAPARRGQESLLRRRPVPQPKTASAASAPGTGHDFGRLRLDAHRGAPELHFRCGLHLGAAGETGCDVSVGVPSYTLDPNQSLCDRDCTTKHELVHVADLTPCCAKAKKAYDKAKTEKDKDAVQDKMNTWVKKNEDYFECRAYAETLRCADEFLAAHCNGGAGSAEQGEAPGQPAASGPMGDPSLTATGPEAASKPQGTQLSQWLAEEPTPAPGGAPPAQFKPELCCSTIKHYRTVHNYHHDAFCKSKKGLTGCPFQ